MQPWLNYHHLLYFWTVVREGSVTAASRKLRLAQPTVSGQVRALEESLGVALFDRQRGKMVLTEAGAHVYAHADEIFAIGSRLQESLADGLLSRRARLVIGVADEVPKIVVQVLVQPVLELEEPPRVVLYEDRQDRLLADLATHALDVVIAEAPVGPGSPVRAHAHLLGESEIGLFASRDLAKRLKRNFPRSLEGAPFLLPIESTIMRGLLSSWFEEHAIHPEIRAEFQDSALLGAFGGAGAGVFAAPQIIEQHVRTQYAAEPIGTLEGLRQRYYAITAQRKIVHEAVRVITERARTNVFAR